MVFAPVVGSQTNDFRLRAQKPRYEELFGSCKVRSSWLPQLQSIAQNIVSRRSQYVAIEEQTTVPWWFVGILHYRDLNFAEAHLHNGDSLSNRTVNAPQGRPEAMPINGSAYSFVESAIDALRWKQFDRAKDRSIPAWLWRFEVWSGFGYASMGLNSEYLWNGTNHYGSGNNRGLLLANGSFDPNARSSNAGAAAILWYLLHQGILDSAAQQNVGAVGTQAQATIQFVDVLKYYQGLPHQNSAIAWLQQQLSSELLAEFTRRWRENPNPAAVPVATQALQQTLAPVATPSPVVTNTPQPVAAPPPAPKPDKVQLNVPYLSQLDNATDPYGTCNVTSLSMCMAFFGHPIKNAQGEQLEDELNRYCYEHGLSRHSPHDLAKVVRDYGYKDDFQENAKWEEVKKWLDQGKPCVVHGYFTGFGHIITIIGYNSKGWIVHDPYGEWFSSGYDKNRSGAALTYSYDMMKRICSPDGSLWIHYISK